MKNNQEAAGYLSYVLPDLLPELERSNSGTLSGDYRLIAADKKTFIWAQNLDNDTPAVIKMYRHRGKIDWQREKTFRFRVQREFNSLVFIDSHNVPCSKPLFWSYGYNPAFGRYEILATREIKNIIPLDTFTQTSKPEVTRSALIASYKLVHLMHRSGCHHGAMYPRNILIARHDTQEPGAFIIDMPKAISFPYDIRGTKMAWIDLYFLTTSVIKYTGAEECIDYMKHYGLEEKAARKFVTHTANYHPSKVARNLFLAESQLWKLMSHFGARCYTSRLLN